MGQQKKSGNLETTLPLGDGNAEVAATRGAKVWISANDAGVTVESTTTVKLKCDQSELGIKAAHEMAGQLAEQLAMDGMEEMGMYIKTYDKHGKLPI